MNDARVENYPLLMRYQARKGRDPNVFILISPNVSATDTSFQAWSASNGVGYIFIGQIKLVDEIPRHVNSSNVKERGPSDTHWMYSGRFR